MSRLTAALVGLAFASAASLAPGVSAQTSGAVFGGVQTPSGLVTPTPDLAFGAFQRGYFATALKEAMTRVDKDRHDGAALALIGEIYAQGLAVRRDPAEAARWYRLAAEQGNREAAFAYGMALLKGEGVPKDHDAAKAMLEQAAAGEHPGALYNLGVMAVEEQDFAKAAGYFQRAADAGDVDALEALSALYRQGRGVVKDLAKALDFLKRAADERDASAEVQYGIILFNGEGVLKDETGAARYFLKAAAVGNPIAENRLARLYAAGRGIGKDAVEAARWHILARAAGVKDVWLDGVLSSLTVPERTRVEELLRRQLEY